jgi:predicted metal-dependent phosphoesterase TrpH
LRVGPNSAAGIEDGIDQIKMTERQPLHPDDPVDLHLHTWASDGRWEPETLTRYLAEQGFRLAAVADHDTMHNVPRMIAHGRAAGIEIIPAVEMTTRWHERQVHVLVYGITLAAPDAGPFRRVLQTQQDQLRETAERAAELLRLHGRFIPALEEVALGLPLTPHHVFSAMIRHGHGSNLYQAHNIVRGLGEPVIVDVPIEDTVRAVHESGGLAIVAHPGRDEGFGVLKEADLDAMLREVPIDGVEAHYRSYNDADVERYRNWAEANALLVSSGSDSHWPSHPVNPTPHPARWVAGLLERLGYEVGPWEGPAWVARSPAEPVVEPAPAPTASS